MHNQGGQVRGKIVGIQKDLSTKQWQKYICLCCWLTCACVGESDTYEGVLLSSGMGVLVGKAEHWWELTSGDIK